MPSTRTPSGVVDLHLHTTASDGAFDPTALVDLAWRAGIRTMSVTDHDTTAGLAEAEDAARRVSGSVEAAQDQERAPLGNHDLAGYRRRERFSGELRNESRRRRGGGRRSPVLSARAPAGEEAGT